ncbi:MAG: N-acetylmuramoyl-L-alanine amidase [Bacilli bacterium]|nr:N-acetylmuramoyl-L-alanine amidase [Bacilli bacterium]MDD4547354.1 N-acetylmuramoyl-L-alanine amidase [Bacilli bacterium]
MLKYRVICLSIFIIGLCLIGFVDAKTNQFPLFGKVIYIDPGHGGVDPGAIYKDIYESDINLQIATALQDTLGEMGAIVYMTRYGDYDLGVPNAINRKRSDLSRRGNIINRSGCDLYISIHLNALESPVWYGAQVFYDDVNDSNIELAKIMQNELSRHFRTKRKYTKTDEMYLHKRIKQPGILIEAGFLSNPNERYLLRKEYYQKKLGRVIAGGIVKFLEK